MTAAACPACGLASAIGTAHYRDDTIMTTTHLTRVIDTACERLNPRAHYATAVIRGRQLWSGADLEGAAANLWSGRYRQQRRAARVALAKAGGVIVAGRKSGRLSTAVRLCVDDYGTTVYDTVEFGVVGADQLRRHRDRLGVSDAD